MAATALDTEAAAAKTRDAEAASAEALDADAASAEALAADLAAEAHDAELLPQCLTLKLLLLKRWSLMLQLPKRKPLKLPPKCRILKQLLPNRTLRQPAADAAVTTNEQQREDAPGCVFPKDRNHQH